MHIDVKFGGSEKVNTGDGCGDISNMEDLVVNTTQAKVKFHSSFTICHYLRAVGSPEAFDFAFVRPVNVFRGQDTEACSSVN